MNKSILALCGILSTTFFLLFSSCMADDTLEDMIVDSILDEYADITFEISQSYNTQTRCIPNEDTTNQDILSESCITNPNHHQNLIVTLAYDNRVLSNDTILINGEMKEIKSHPYIINLKKINEYNVSLTYRFLKNMDPSKIELVCISCKHPLNSYFPSLINIEDGINQGSVNFNNLCEYCVFYKRHYLTGYNNWNSIDSKITLKRNSAQIIVLSPHQNYDSKGVKWMNSFLNYQTSVNHLAQVSGLTVSLGFGLADFSYSRHYLSDNRICIEAQGMIWNSTSITKESVFKSQRFAIFGENKVRYNNKDYYYFTPFSVFASENPSYPLTTDGQPYKYVTLIGFTERNIPYEVYWSNLPLPEGGLQANKRYIYILNSSFNFWDNGPISKTRSQDSKVVNSSDFEIVELDMDDPSPFES